MATDTHAPARSAGETEQLIALLKELEWSAGSWDDHICPKCRNSEEEGHKPVCPLAGLLYHS